MKFSRSGYDTQIKFSPEELYQISQDISRRFAPAAPQASNSPPANIVNNRPFRPKPDKNGKKVALHTSRHSRTRLSAQEIFAISNEVSRRFAPEIASATSELVLLPVDPQHLYAYWTIDESQHTARLTHVNDNPLVLRVYWRPDAATGVDDSKIWFDVALHSLQSRQKVRLPVDGTAYSAVVGRLAADNSLTRYACSNTVHVPCRTRATPVAIDTAPALRPPHQPWMPAAQAPHSEFYWPTTVAGDVAAGPSLGSGSEFAELGLKEHWFFTQLTQMLVADPQAISQQIIFKSSPLESTYRPSKTASGLGR